MNGTLTVLQSWVPGSIVNAEGTFDGVSTDSRTAAAGTLFFALQGEKFDAEGKFVRRWIPELKDFPADLIQQPWENPLLLSKSKYQSRIVRHEEQREKCLAMFKAVKG